MYDQNVLYIGSKWIVTSPKNYETESKKYCRGWSNNVERDVNTIFLLANISLLQVYLTGNVFYKIFTFADIKS